MATEPATQRPQNLHISKSFVRHEPSQQSPVRSRANTLQSRTIPEHTSSMMEALQSRGNISGKEDIFEKNSSDAAGGTKPSLADITSPRGMQGDFDELPIEIISLTDRYGATL